MPKLSKTLEEIAKTLEEIANNLRDKNKEDKSFSNYSNANFSKYRINIKDNNVDTKYPDRYSSNSPEDKEESRILDQIYSAITLHGSNPYFHNKKFSELENDWPTLHRALMRLIKFKQSTDKKENP